MIKMGRFYQFLILNPNGIKEASRIFMAAIAQYQDIEFKTPLQKGPGFTGWSGALRFITNSHSSAESGASRPSPGSLYGGGRS